MAERYSRDTVVVTTAEITELATNKALDPTVEYWVDRNRFAYAPDRETIKYLVSGDGNSAGAGLGESLDFGKSSTITLLGDSTANETTEWFYQFAQYFAIKYQNTRIEHFLWNDATQAYDAPSVIQSGNLETVLAFDDTFSTTSVDVYGRSPDTGLVWDRDGANASGDWAATGGNMVRSADVVTGTLLFGGGVPGDQVVRLNGMSFSTVGDGTARTFFLYFKWLDAINHLRFELRVSATGVVQWVLYKVLAGVATNIANISNPAAMPGSTALVQGDIVMSSTGLTCTVAFGATTLSANILQSDADTLGQATKGGISGPLGNFIGTTISQVKMDVTPTAGSIQTVKFKNCSFSGSTLAYHAARLPLMLPDRSDLVILSSSHNYANTLPPVYISAVSNICGAINGMYPNSAIWLSGQNPRKVPSGFIVEHAERLQALRAYARSAGYGYLPVYEKFIVAQNWQTLVESDGVHPTKGATSGSSLWASTAQTLLEAVVEN